MIISRGGETAPFVMNPPIRLLKKRSEERVGIIYTGGKSFNENEFLLSVSFIPMNVSADKAIILSQTLPVYYAP